MTFNLNSYETILYLNLPENKVLASGCDHITLDICHPNGAMFLYLYVAKDKKNEKKLIAKLLSNYNIPQATSIQKPEITSRVNLSCKRHTHVGLLTG